MATRMSTSNKKRVVLRVEGVMATTDMLPEEVLKKWATKMVGKPMMYEHRGKPIGLVEEAWYKDGKLFFRAGLYEPKTKEQEEALESVRSGKVSGVSPSFFYRSRVGKSTVVFHGSIVNHWEKDGKFYVRALIPKDEIEKKIGSLENLKGIEFINSFLHDGSIESKERIEKLVLERSKSRRKFT